MDKSLKVQQESVDTQIATMKLDQRPYIRVAAIGVRPADKGDTDNDYQGVLSLVAIGRTPATFLQWKVYCAIFESNEINGAVWTEGEVAKRPNIHGGENLIILGESGVTWTTSSEAVLNSGDSIQVECPFSRTDYLSGKPNDDVDADRQIVDDKSTMMTFIVDVTYSDVFDSKHRTQQCFYVPDGNSPVRAKLLSCQKYRPILE